MNESNPYSSPADHAASQPGRQSVPPRFSILAVVVGWLADIAVSMVVGFGLGIVMAIVMIASGTAPQDIEKALNESTPVHIAGIGIGALSTMFGAYLAAWIAKHSEIQHALGVGVLSGATGGLLFAIFPDWQPGWVSLAGIVLVLPAALVGGYMRRQRSARKSASADGS